MSNPPNAPPPSSLFSSAWVSSLAPAERAEFLRLVTPRLTSYIPHRPHPPQAAFLLLTNREALFGGAAGGGKSDALLMAALQYVDVPGYAALLLRRSFAQLVQADALIPRAHEWLQGTDARWNEQKHVWTFPSGAVLKFGHLQHENDKYDYQGSAWQFVGFDELTQYSETQYTYLISRTRRLEGANVSIRIRASANPGGEGHEWVKRRFITEGRARGRVFIPSKLHDNPSLDREDYLKSLAELDPVTRAQLLDGNWDVRQKGSLFKREWFKVIPEDDERLKGLRWIRYWDLAATEVDERKKNDPDWTAGAKVAVRRLPDGKRQVYVRDVRRKRGSPGAVEDFIAQTAKEDGKSVPIHLEEEPGSAGKNNTHNYKSRVLFGWTVHGHRKTGSKESFWGPLASQAEGGNAYLVEGDWIGWWLDEAEAAPNPGVHDDGLDAVANGFAEAQTKNLFIT